MFLAAPRMPEIQDNTREHTGWQAEQKEPSSGWDGDKDEGHDPDSED